MHPPHSFFASAAKRVMDVLGASLLLVVLSPLFLLVAMAVKRDGGPVFFLHQRVGQFGRRFSCYKFRSMVHHAEEKLAAYLAAHPEAQAEWEAEQKLKNDPRVTRFGKFMRASSIDELPQLFNVLKGEMSLVGPRPIVQEEVVKYKGDIADYYRVKPGITGLWQVSGRSDISYDQRVQLDSYYVRNWSLWRDISILLLTVPALLQRKGAY